MSEDQEGLDFYVEMPELSDIDAWDGEQSSADAGDYLGPIVNVERKPTSTGKTMLVVQTEIEAAADGSETPMKGRQVWNRYTESGKALKRLKALLLATGVQINSRGGYNAKELVGKKYAFTVFKEEYDATDEVTGDVETRMGTKVRGERRPDGQRVTGLRA